LLAQQVRCDLQDGEGAGLTGLLQAVGGATVCDLHGCGEVRVAVQLQGVLHGVVGAGRAQLAGGDHVAAVWHAGVVLVELLLADEVHLDLVAHEVVRHGADVVLDPLLRPAVSARWAAEARALVAVLAGEALGPPAAGLAQGLLGGRVYWTAEATPSMRRRASE